MKKFYMILAAIAALTISAQAQNAGTINIGNWDDASLYNGSYFDMAPTNFYLAHTGSQMIYTPDVLTDLEGKQNVKITGLKFKFYDETYEEIVRNTKVYLQETDATEFAKNQDGIKQFFEFGEPVYEVQLDIDMLETYGDDYTLEFPVDFNFTPGKSLLVTIIFDAEDDDNCTMGSDYASFYTSGISGKAMTYTDNSESFIEFAQGSDWPNSTAMLGCGTNVELPVTEISYTYEEEQTGDLVPAVPADPIIYEDSWFDSGEEDGYSCFDFLVNPVDVDGNPIDQTHILYSIFTDEDVPFVFDAATYMVDLEEDMTEIPYEIYSEGYDFDMSRIYFYRTNSGDNPMFNQRIGIQVHYDVPVTTVGKETTIVRNSSNIVYWYLPTTAITEVNINPVTRDDAYYNMMGQRFTGKNLPAGIYIHNGKKIIVK